jgi:hypothetical protein
MSQIARSQRRPKVVNGVSNDKAKFLGDGLVLFELYRALAGFVIAFEDKTTRLILEEGGYLPI